MKKKLQAARKIKSLLLILLMVCLSSFPVFAVTPTLLECDINGDGIINVSDLNEMSNHMGATGTPGWTKEDVDKNGIVQVVDMMFVANYYGESVTTNGGTTTGGTTNGVARIQKMSICYSGRIGNSACRTYIAQHFDLADISNGYPNDAQWLKDNAVNPNIKVINYYDIVFSSGQQDSWYVHSGGNIVTGSGGGGSVMNPGSGWANYFVQRAKTLLNNYPQYDGIFVDDLWYDPTYDNEYWSSSPSSWDLSMSAWKSAMVTFMGNLKTTLGNDIVMGNVEPPSALGVIGDQTKAVILEHFVHKLETSASDNGRPVTTIIQTIDYLHGQAEKGNIIAGLSGCNAGTGVEDWCKFCYACLAFAVVDPAKAYFAWNFMGSSPTTNPTWFQWMDDYVLGTPTDTYHSISGNVYERTFANYYVIANLNNLGSSVTFTFNGASHTLEGKHALFISR